MSSESVQPLRINKSTPASSLVKSNGSSAQRPLSEITSTERRRNSPSYSQATRNMVLNRDSSPFDTSPFNKSPRLFWQGRDPNSPSRFDSENSFDREFSPSPHRRSSIENLKKASRVKNSAMFAREQKNEYDPTSVQVIERPLAAGRPLSTQVQGNAFGGRGVDAIRSPAKPFGGHRRGESQSKMASFGPSKTEAKAIEQASATSPSAKPLGSPTKSSLSTNGRFNHFEPESGIWSEDDSEFKASTPRPLRRHAKSVTFDAAPPQINEYEMVTPDPSSVASGSREGSYDSEYTDEDESFGRGSSMDRDDSFDASLEDADKTPVVLPEDWRHMSPDNANTSLADTFEDPFDGRESSPMPTATPNQKRPDMYRSNSTNSDGSSRPLPPLPGNSDTRGRRESSVGLSAAAERVSSAQRSLPSPPRAAAISKAEILGMRDASMSLEDRLRLMGLQDLPQHSAEGEHTAPLPATEVADVKDEPEAEHSVADVDDSLLQEIKIPRISRESILRKVKSRNFGDIDFDFHSARSSPEPEPEQSYGDLDPDVPIPSREASSNFDEVVPDIPIKEEGESGNEIDIYSVPELYQAERSPSRMDDYPRESSVIHHVVNKEIDDGEGSVTSRYSPQSEPEQQAQSNSTTEDEGPPTPKAEDFLTPKSDDTRTEKFDKFDHKHMSLPEFGLFLNNDDFNLQLQPYMSTPDTEAAATASLESAPKLDAVHSFLEQPITPLEDLPLPVVPGQIFNPEDERCDTPDSVIHHSVVESPQRDSPSIPEAVATIRAPGGKLKTRPSATPADMAAMAASRRQVSGEHPPPIPQRNARRPSMSVEPEAESLSSEGAGFDSELQAESEPKRHESFMMLDIPNTGIGEDIGLGLDREFERVIESQKKGYLMRQNTKVVVASSRQFSNEKPPMSPTGETMVPDLRGTRSAGSNPRKASHERTKSWTTEPWNGKPRRKSVRQNSVSTSRKSTSGPVPPLPDQESNVNGLGTVAEDGMVTTPDEDEGAERGRLFVKVVGVKDLDLPLSKTEKTWFQLTLDNGLHCVTTSWLELGRSAPIGQEFELVVLNDLEFQLTLQTKLQEPPKTVEPMPAPPAKVASPKKQSAFSRLLSSPKKRKETERKQQEELDRAEQRRQEELRVKRASIQPTAWDLLHDLVAPDGSFARAYICLKNHENQAFGRPFTVDVPCFNEWAVEDSIVNSVKSKRGGVVRKPPYRVGKLTLQLLYVPKPKGAKDEDMPKSLNACVRELREAEEQKARTWEGHLSQQGGDCPYWRRRFFRLTGGKLTAFHESTRQPRATINLAKAVKLIDDRSSLTQSASTKNGGRRKSAFAEEEEAYMFVEEGFRIRFANGECIDFYADNAADKEGWMKVLSETVGKEARKASGGWTDLVLEKEKREKALLGTHMQKEGAGGRPSMGRTGSRTAPTSPSKPPRDAPPPPPMEKSPRHSSQRQTGMRREQVRSMVF